MYLFNKRCRYFFLQNNKLLLNAIFMIYREYIPEWRFVSALYLKKFLRSSHVCVCICVNKYRGISVSIEECLLSLHMYTRNEIRFLASLCSALLLFSLRFDLFPATS